MNIYPLTPGLLASAALRANHAIFMPDVDMGAMIMMRPWQERIPAGLERALEDYRHAQEGTLSDLQVLEEFNGEGFYSPEKEGEYLAILDAWPGMTAKATEIISSSA